MSLILDALRRADSARSRDVATRVAQALPPRARHTRIWPWFAMTAVAVSVAAFAWYAATRPAAAPGPVAASKPLPARTSKLADIPLPPRATDAAPTPAPTRAALPPAVRAALPAVALDAHVWSDDPAKRFVMIGGRLLRVGDAVVDGLVLTAIAHDGAEFSWRGTRFRVPAR